MLASASTGTNTRRRRPPAAATTAAARAALPQLAMARSGPAAGTGQPQALGDLEVQEHTHKVPALVRAGDIAGLVLDPDPAAALEAEASGEVLAALGTAWP